MGTWYLYSTFWEATDCGFPFTLFPTLPNCVLQKFLPQTQPFSAGACQALVLNENECLLLGFCYNSVSGVGDLRVGIWLAENILRMCFQESPELCWTHEVSTELQNFLKSACTLSLQAKFKRGYQHTLNLKQIVKIRKSIHFVKKPKPWSRRENAACLMSEAFAKREKFGEGGDKE